MNNIVSIRRHPAEVITPRHPSLDKRRRASWLLSPYTDPTWTVCNPDDPDVQRVIDFRLIMPDGRLLTEHEHLYRTVKEYAWWFRDTRFSKVEHVDVYVTRVGLIMYIAHALMLRKIDCFSKLLPLDIEELTQECVVGVDGVLRASKRLVSFLEGVPFGSLPVRIGRKNPKRELDRRGTLMLACLPPAGASRLQRVTFLLDQRCALEGLYSKPNRLQEMPPHQPITCQRLSDWLTTFELLLSMRSHLEAPTITFKPFARGAARVAAVKGSEAARTPTAPPFLALRLLERATVWIAEHQADAAAASRPGADRSMIMMLATACWIVVATFSARRDMEIDGLQAGCMHGNDEDGWWLNTHIAKTLQRKDFIPVPAIVARAVECLEAISAEAREATGDQKLFMWLDPATGLAVDVDCGKQLDRFADLVEIPNHRRADGSMVRWHWTPHQFRRFFAILYFWRFEGAQLEALSHHLRHFNLEMTRRYITEDSEAAGIWYDTEWGYRAYVARAVVLGERRVSGSMGKRLQQLAERIKEQLRKKLRVIRPEQADALLIDATVASVEMAMDRQRLVLTPKPWVTCSCPRTAIATAKAACRQDSDMDHTVGPDFSQAGPTVCSGCPWAMLEKDRVSYVAEERNRLLLRQATAPRNSIIARLEDARLVEVKRVIDNKYQAEGDAA